MSMSTCSKFQMNFTKYHTNSQALGEAKYMLLTTQIATLLTNALKNILRAQPFLEKYSQKHSVLKDLEQATLAKVLLRDGQNIQKFNETHKQTGR